MSYRIVFMGTPDFAVPTLKALHESAHEVCLVVTQPDRRKGRGQKNVPPPVKVAAGEMNLPVHQVHSIREETLQQPLIERQPDFLVVIAFGQLLPQAVLDIPRHAPVNLHASLLPKYRGAAPIQWAIINGEKQTGVTAMWMDTGMDTGDMLKVCKTPIGDKDTAADLHDRLARMAADLMLETLDDFIDNRVVRNGQDHAQSTYAPMLTKAHGGIDWRRNASEVEALIRGVTPWPGAFTYYKGQRLKIHAAEVVALAHDQPPGSILRGFDDELRVACGKGAVAVKALQGASGRRLSAAAYLRGKPIPPGEVLTHCP